MCAALPWVLRPAVPRGPWGVLWLVCAVVRGTAGFQDPDYLPTLPEDPLQPVWEDLDTIPLEILNGFKDQMDFHSHEMQASLTEILSRLSVLEEKVQQEVAALRQDIGDLVTGRLVNAEAMILEDISTLSKDVTTSVRDICGTADHGTPLAEQVASLLNTTLSTATTTCSGMVGEAATRAEAAVTRVEAAASRAEEAVTRAEAAATRAEETASRVEAAATRLEEGAARVAEAAASVEGGNRTQQVTGAAEGYRTARTAYLPRDCSDIHWHHPEGPSGVYQTFPTLDPKAAVRAYCDMGGRQDKDTGGWTVVLRRHNTSWGLQDFNRSWVEYREGFGQPGQGEWWYGLGPLHALTYRQPFEVEFILHDMELGTFLAAYTTFRVESEGSNFRLVSSGFSGNVTYDALASMHQGEPFSTYDRDHDSLQEGNCASNNGGGWWYKKCHKAALTATFPGSRDREARTIRWYTPDGWLLLDDVVMKIRPTHYGQRFQGPADGE